MTPGSVDLIIPVFNAAATLRDAIRSVQAQRYSPLRIIIVDDGSSDGSPDITSSLAVNDPRVVAVRRPNGGIAAAMNSGLEIAQAEFIARLDADDLCGPNRVSLQVAFLQQNAEVVAVGGAHREIDSAGRPTGCIFHPAPIEDVDPWFIPAREPQLTQPFFMGRMSVLQSVGGFRALPVAEDSDLYWRLLERGRLANLDEILGSYRMHSASISSRSVHNGRLLAVCSQLAALSAQQRWTGRCDDALQNLERLQIGRRSSMAELVRTASRGLDSASARWLRAATAAKLMELSGYRPYELEPSDCRFIAAAMADLPPLGPANRKDLRKMRAATAARLLRLGRVRDVLSLATPDLWPEIAARAGTGRLYWHKNVPA